ncbi:alpha/beta fold hydrolase [Salinisphaera sp. Q1T1-3]|nr:alpha/beta fold hydrolase [Salinisphaera sp. Q1T1-3]
MPLLFRATTTARRLAERAPRLLREPPEWQTGLIPMDEAAPFDVIHRRAGATLRHYPKPSDMPQPAAAPRTPVVLVPPLSVHVGVYDLSRERSMVSYLQARGFDVYLVDWGRASRADDRRRLADYFAGLLPEMLNRVRVHSGRKRLSLHGWGGGGHFALCHAAMSAPDAIANLVLVATPIDYHHSGALGARVRRMAARGRRLREATGLVFGRMPPVLLHAPGWMSELALRWGPRDGPADGDDAAYAEETALRLRATGVQSHDGAAAYPGGFVADVIDHLWIDNALAAGRLPLRGSRVGLENVRVPILVVTGQRDQQATPAATRALADVVSSRDLSFLDIDAGHVGALTGEAAARESWPRIADWLCAHDRPRR